MKKHLTFQPTTEQVNALNEIEKFVSPENKQDVFILRGSAGTGKTSLIKALACHLKENEMKFFIAAPTGRAAKVISAKTERYSQTVHSMIYTPEQITDGIIRLKRKINSNNEYTLFIIDESSMISDRVNQSENFKTGKPLLSDFIDYVKQGNPTNKILFIGDVFQLPPVLSNESPALSPLYIQHHFKLNVKMIELTEVKRQNNDSYILNNATLLRNCMNEGKLFSGLKCKSEMNFTAALKRFLNTFDNAQLDKVIFIAYSNKDVNFFNNAVRDRLFGQFAKPELANGDVITLHANWAGNNRMIMKGDYGIVKSVNLSKISKVADLRFAQAQIEFTEADGKKFCVTTQVLLDTLGSQDGNINFEKEKALFAEAMKHNPVFRASKMPWDDQYVGAMRLRFGYATTCHKAQGGEWDNVILHQYYDRKDYRWLYTAITRARHELYSYAA
ncbi:MAG: ATP-dependent RecD-like DNA helicase [Bacteroidia bacterium]|nr:ATP-dependent RecD-like DNA helicase [Bacteroidia bacterium]